jgi:Ca2+/Na+ antiporter
VVLAPEIAIKNNDMLTPEFLTFYNLMWTLMLGTSSIRLHHSWIWRSIAILLDVLVPKIYFSIDQGYYLSNPAFGFIFTGLYLLMVILLIENLRQAE